MGERLSSGLGQVVVDGVDPVGFALQAPEGDSRLFVLLDRSGLVLARSRSLDDCVGVLLRHLGVFADRPPATHRFRLRALELADGGFAVAVPPLFVEPPVTERQLLRVGARLVDRLSFDVTTDGRLESTEWGLGADVEISGHCSAPGSATTSRLLVQGVAERPPSHAEVVAQVLNNAADPMSADVLEAAIALAKTDVRIVSATNSAGRYASLQA